MYLSACSAVHDVLSEFYTETQTLGYAASKQCPAYPLFHCLTLSAHMNQRQANLQLVKDLCTKFGLDPALIFGN
ncbi:hypothetical protein GGI15_002001 [Coemansia interrupta]|uniref:Uncharacterized protein n=1 Tax=Coemansia interrupta TaxID=1126814 RepID=A0A9W8HKE6_9FUNG|nr:hypothetical protein GGI15_002001 [Coemansia interrupta]